MAVVKSQFTLRLKPEVQGKIQYIAKKENRSLSNMIECSILDKIQKYEQEQGEIILNDDEIYPK